MIGGCADVEAYCGHAAYGGIVRATCPATCGLCCYDDDARAVALARQAGATIGGCADVRSYCGHPRYGGTARATCPLTCGACGDERRLAEGKDPIADELDWIEELTA